MASTRMDGAPWCSSAAELRKSIKSAPKAVKQRLLRSSGKTLAAVREDGPILAYFLSDTPSDLLFIGAVTEQFRLRKSHYTRYGLAKPVMLVVVNESHDGSVEQVLAVIEQRTGRQPRKGRNSGAWIIRAEGHRDSRIYIVQGSPDRMTLNDESKYWASVTEARDRVVEMMAQCSDDAKQDHFVVYNTACPILLSSMPESIFDRIKAVVMVGGFQEENNTELFRMSEFLYSGASVLQALFNVAQHRFPLLFVDFSYSSSKRIRSLHHLPGFIHAWPKLFHPKNYAEAIQGGLDDLYLNMMRFAGAARKRSGQECAKKAVDLAKRIDPQKLWVGNCLEVDAYSPTHCDLAKCIENGGNISAAMDCPIDSFPDSLAGLIPSATLHISSTELVAVQFAYEASTNRDCGINFALSETSPAYVLIDMSADSKVDDAFIATWKEFVTTVKKRSSAPKVAPTMARSWKQFVAGTGSLVQWLVDDEKSRKGGKTDMERLQKNAASGAFTAICKRSLGK